MPQSSAETLEQVIEDDPRKQPELSVPQYEPGEWKHDSECRRSRKFWMYLNLDQTVRAQTSCLLI